MDWQEIDIGCEDSGKESFAVVGNGRIKLSKGACKLIKNFNKCKYVSFLKAKKDRIHFVGLRFEEKGNLMSYRLHKIASEQYGAMVVAKGLIGVLYGEEGKSKTYTKHFVVKDDIRPDVLIVFHNYQKKYYLKDSDKPLRGKHIGTIVDKEWKVVSSRSKNEAGKKSPSYLLKNINSGEEIWISSRALFDIYKGLTTVDNLKLCRKMGVAKYNGMKRSQKKKRIQNLD